MPSGVTNPIGGHQRCLAPLRSVGPGDRGSRHLAPVRLLGPRARSHHRHDVLPGALLRRRCGPLHLARPDGRGRRLERLRLRRQQPHQLHRPTRLDPAVGDECRDRGTQTQLLRSDLLGTGLKPRPDTARPPIPVPLRWIGGWECWACARPTGRHATGPESAAPGWTLASAACIPIKLVGSSSGASIIEVVYETARCS